MDCLFCKIIKKEISARIIYEDNSVIGFLDINPQAPGHTIVIPKDHVENILELTPKKIGPFFDAVQKITNNLKKGLSPDGFTIGINQGEASGQTIPHLHVHIMPRFQNDGGGSLHCVVNNPPKRNLDEIARKIHGIS